MMGYMTPNIDRVAREGVSFTDYYGQQSCTAGRATFIGSGVPVRNGMTEGAVIGFLRPGHRNPTTSIPRIPRSMTKVRAGRHTRPAVLPFCEALFGTSAD
jgi:arylsulfatase A-like enzyme